MSDGGDTSAPSFADRGFLLGDGLFETIRLYGDHPFRLEAHLARLHGGAGRVGIRVPERLEEEVARVLAKWRERASAAAAAADESEVRRLDGVLRITLTRGEGHGLLPPEEEGEGARPTLVVTARPYEADADICGKGLRARLHGRVDERALTAGVKGIGYLERVVALRKARADGADEALLMNSTGAVVEGSASNLFVWRDEVLHTPSAAEGALPGITREVVLALAAADGLSVLERAPEPAALLAAEEIFLTSSLRELAPVVEVEGCRIGSGSPGALFHRLHDSYRNVVRAERGA